MSRKIILLFFVFVFTFCFYASDQKEERAEKILHSCIKKALSGSGDKREAIKECTKAIELNPKHPEAYEYRGLAKMDLKDFKGAIQDFTKAVELLPKYESTYTTIAYGTRRVDPYYTRQYALAYFHRADAKKYLKDYKGAIQDYTKAMEIWPDLESDVYLNIGLIKESLKDYGDAIQYFTNSIKVKFDKFEAYLRRGVVKERLKDYKGAIQDYNKAIIFYPEYAIAYYYRGLCKIFLGDKKGGCLDLSKAGELGYSGAYDKFKDFCQ